MADWHRWMCHYIHQTTSSTVNVLWWNTNLHVKWISILILTAHFERFIYKPFPQLLSPIFLIYFFQIPVQPANSLASTMNQNRSTLQVISLSMCSGQLGILLEVFPTNGISLHLSFLGHFWLKLWYSGHPLLIGTSTPWKPKYKPDSSFASFSNWS